MQCSLDHIFLPLRHGGLSIWNSQCEADGAPHLPWASYRTPAGLGSRRNLAASPALSAPAYYTKHDQLLRRGSVCVAVGRSNVYLRPQHLGRTGQKDRRSMTDKEDSQEYTTSKSSQHRDPAMPIAAIGRGGRGAV
jgi:hypothetical protein